jgi:hypothetical protein
MLAQAGGPFHIPTMSKETPCIAVCMMDPRTNLCFGCGRTLPEIARWHRWKRPSGGDGLVAGAWRTPLQPASTIQARLSGTFGGGAL